METVFVVVVTFNGMKWLEKSIASVYGSDIPTRLVVVDNGSTDESVSFIKSNYPAAVLIETKSNLGFGKANNIGMRYALQEGADYVFLLNQDGYLMDNTLRILVESMKRNPAIGVLSPMQLNGDGSKMDRNFEKLMNYGYCPDFVSDNYFGRLNSTYKVGFVMAAFWLLNRDTMTRVGLFNPIFKHYGEDNDYLNRLRFHNVEVRICANTLGYHDREDREESIERKIYLQYIQYLVRINDCRLNMLSGYFSVLLFLLRHMFSLVLKRDLKRVKLHCSIYYNLILKQTFKIIAMRNRIRKGEAIELSDFSN